MTKPDRKLDDGAIGEVLGRVRGRVAASVRTHQSALHEIPETAFEERATAAYLTGALEALGIAPRTGVAGTGLFAELPGAGVGPTVMVRADMDGLPIDEDPSNVPRSRHDGRMHACGHDGHMAIVLGLAESLARSAEATLPGRVLLLFQPAEEDAKGGASGAQRIVESGLLDEQGVDAVLGLHLWSYLPLGQAILPDRLVMASSDEVSLVFSGGGGHAALPHEAQDVVLAASRTVDALQSIVARDVDPVCPAVVSIGTFHAGRAANVLPAEARLTGTLRAADRPARELLSRRVTEIAQGIAAAHGVTVDVEISRGYPATINDPRAAATVREAARAVLGEGAVHDGPPSMGAEDFAYYLERRPGAFLLLGMRDEASGAVHPHHSPRFRIAPQALPLGVEILLRGALALMRETPLIAR